MKTHPRTPPPAVPPFTLAMLLHPVRELRGLIRDMDALNAETYALAAEARTWAAEMRGRRPLPRFGFHICGNAAREDPPRRTQEAAGTGSLEPVAS